MYAYRHRPEPDNTSQNLRMSPLVKVRDLSLNSGVQEKEVAYIYWSGILLREGLAGYKKCEHTEL